EPWQGQKKPPYSSCTVASASNVGEQPRCVQVPISTSTSGLIERYSLVAYSGCCATSDVGSANLPLSAILSRPLSMSLVRRTTHTGWPRYSRTTRWPASSLLISTSSGAPAFSARALGCHDLTKGTAAPTTPTAPTADVTPIK